MVDQFLVCFRIYLDDCLFNSVHERLLRTSEDFVWPIDSTFHGRFVIDVEFIDLKISTLNVRASYPLLDFNYFFFEPIAIDLFVL